MISLKDDLNNEQINVVKNADGPCLVLAGAGSGKTRTVTYRVAYLLSQGIPPEYILMLTFTNKAAREMNARIEEITGGKIRLPWSGTFHHIAYRILKKFAGVLEYQPNFTILDSGDSLDLMKVCLKLEGVDRKQKRFPSPKVIQSIISYARNAETTIEDVLELKYPNWMDHAEILRRIANEYAKRKKEANAMDFDDLLVNLYRLLMQSAKVRNLFAEQFHYVMVDEYQDTNRIQASIIKLFASVHGNILVVGDDAQSIYSFRAADIQNILDFEKQYRGAKVFRLQTNYRSTPQILDVANDVIAKNIRQYEKELKSVRDESAKPEVHAFADDREEATFIADQILEMRDEGIKLSNMAVLFRAAFHSQALEMELAKRDIPYDYRGGLRFFDRAHVKDVLAFLRVRSNRDDVIAWSRLLNMQVGIGPASANKLIEAIRGLENIKDLATAGEVLGARGKIGWNDFLQIWDVLDAEEQTPDGLIRGVLSSKYKEYLELEYPDYRDRLQDIEQMAVFAERANDLATFLAEATMQEKYTKGKEEGVDYDEPPLVLSTIHQAKGLEWDAVFVMGLASGKFPNERAMTERNGVEEERRLFYVAVTRARHHLYLTYPMMGGFTHTLQGPSMFLDEISRDLVHQEVLGESSVFTDPSDDIDDITYVADDDDIPFPSRNDKRSFLKDIYDL